MRLLSLDYDPVYGDGATRSIFAGDLTVFDYDVVIWDPAATFKYYLGDGYISYYQNLPSLSEHRSVQIQADAIRRRAEFEEFTAMGRVLIAIARPPQQCYVDTGERRYSGTGRNQKTTQIVDRFDLLAAVLGDNSTFEKAGGTRVSIAGDGPFSRVLRTYKDLIRYTAVISNISGGVLATVPGTKRVISAINQVTSNGYIVLLPTFALRVEVEDQSADDDDEDAEHENDDDDDEERWCPEASKLQDDLVAAAEAMTGGAGRSWPSWADWYLTTAQRQLRVDVAKQQRRIESARARLAKVQRQTEEAEAKNQLFLGTGRPLELEVKKVLELLGGTVTDPEPNRDDWKVSFPEGDAVIEVKGVTKSAAEKHAAQLEKWVAATLDESGKHVKGILVVNTWKDLPLVDRIEDDFPNQMLSYSERREHCLVTGLHLFVIQNLVANGTDEAELWRTRLLNNIGRLVVETGWQSVVSEISLDGRDAG